MENEIEPAATNLSIEADETIDESNWRDIDIFLPFDAPDQFDQIQTLFRVSNYRPNINFSYFDCRHTVGIGKCKYKIRWRKSDGMVQSKGKHGHQKFYPLTWRKCRECNFECVNKAMLSNHYLQNHNDKQFRQCPKCAAIFEDPNELHWHIRRMHVNKKKKENSKGNLDELQQRFDVIIREWEQAQEQQQQRMEQPQVASTSNSIIDGGLSNDRHQNAAQNNNFQQQSNLIPSTSNAMLPAETPYFLKTTNWPQEIDGKLEENIAD